MTGKEKKALEKAFGLPEPERKEEFLSSLEITERKFSTPALILRFAAIAAMAVLALGLWSVFRGTEPKRDHEPEQDMIVTAVSATAAVTSESNETKTTAAFSSITEGAKHGTSTVLRTDEPLNEKSIPTVSVQEKTTTAHRNGSPVQQSATMTVSTGEARKSTAVNQTTATRDAPVLSTTIATVTHINTTIADRIVIPTRTCVPSGTIIDISESKPMGEVDGDPPAGEAMPHYAEMYLREADYLSDQAVLARVDSVCYPFMNNEPYTQLDVTVLRSYKGDFDEGFRLSIAFRGGYAYAEDYFENAPDLFQMCREMFGEEVEQADVISKFETELSMLHASSGMTYLFFLTENKEICPEGQLTPSSDDFSVLPYSFGKFWFDYLQFTEEQLIDLLATENDESVTNWN